MKPETVYLVAFFKWDDRGNEYGFKRVHLQHIFKTEEEARNISFCDEAGWYEGVLIEERPFGFSLYRGKRVWLIQQPDASLKEIEEPKWFGGVVNIVG